METKTETRSPGTYQGSYIVSLAIFFLLLLCGVVIYMAPHLGWMVDGVRSGSMSPTIKRGTLVVAEPVKAGNVALGDIIIFRKDATGENYVCHRVIGKTRNSPIEFQTRGDANPFPDPEPVPARNILARVIWHFPIIGFAAIFFKTPMGFIVSVVVPGFTVAFICLAALRSELKREKEGRSRSANR